MIALVATVNLSSCGDTLQNQPVHDRDLLAAVRVPHFPIYWLGRSFEGMTVSGVQRDTGGAFAVPYGNCLVGGQSTCVAPLVVVTSPDNGFLPGGSAHRTRLLIRSRHAAQALGGRTLEIATGPVVVDVYARTPALAQAAARSLAPINRPGSPSAPLPPPVADTGADRNPPGGPTQRYVQPPPGPAAPGDLGVGGLPSPGAGGGPPDQSH